MLALVWRYLLTLPAGKGQTAQEETQTRKIFKRTLIHYDANTQTAHFSE